MTGQPSPDFRVDHQDEGDCALLRVFGEVDVAVCDEFHQAIVGIDHDRDIIIDLSATTFIDSSGIRSLVNGSRERQRRGGVVSIVGPTTNSRVRRVMDLVHIEQVTPVHDTVAEASNDLEC